MSLSETFDTNIDNYSIHELMDIIQINELTREQVINNTNKNIKKSKKSKILFDFFNNIKSKLLNEIDLNENEINEDETNKTSKNDKWINTSSDFNSNIRQPTKMYNNDHYPIKKDDLNMQNNYNIPIAQGKLNPNLKNTVSRVLNLDSQFRQLTTTTTSTNYTANISEPLDNVLKIRLYSYQIPYSWYVFDKVYGNTCLWISDSGIIAPITIPCGNYSATNFVIVLINAFRIYFPETNYENIIYDVNSGKLTFNLNGLVGHSFTITEESIITFFDPHNNLNCQTTCTNSSNYIDQTLGWYLGFRSTHNQVCRNGNSGEAIVDLIGTKYLMLVIDDFNQNHVNNSIVSITQQSNNLKMPSYYSTDMPYICTHSIDVPSTLDLEDNESDDENDPCNNPSNIGQIPTINYKKTPQIIPSAPRTLTSAQLYTINEINKTQNNLTNYRSKAPTSSDILAIIPIKLTNTNTGALFVDFSGSLQDNNRTYFGPVNIDRIKVKLLDDKGRVINLNGSDWCVSIIVDCLYQY